MFKPLLPILSIFIIISSTIVINLIIDKNRAESTFSCTANYIQNYNDSKMNIVLGYNFSNESSYLSITGDIINSGEKLTLDRRVSFNYKMNGNIYELKSIKNIRFPSDVVEDEKILPFIPKFFVKPGNEIQVRILPQPGEQYLFVFSSIPSYLCKSSST